MGLRETAAADFKRLTEDEGGFSWPMTLIDPDGTEYELQGLSTDIHLTIDPQTGQSVSGRNASVSISLRSLADAGADIPRSVSRRSQKPWLVKTEDISGNEHTFKVAESYPDQAIGNVVLRLEAYDNG